MTASQRVLIIGGTACGPKAAARIKRLEPESEVTLLEKSETLSFGACGMPYYVEGLFEDIGTLTETPVGVKRTPEFFKRCKGVEVHTGTEAERIDREKKEVIARRKGSGEELAFAYDRLVLATGARAVRPPIPGADLANIWTMKESQDAVTLNRAIGELDAKRAVIVGAGLIGVEMAEALSRRGLEVTLVEMFDKILPQLLDKEMAMLGAKHLQAKGVRLELGAKVTAFTGESRVDGVRIREETLPADLVLIAAGVKQNDELAREAGLECYATGGIKINHFCQTSDPSIYAGGDCVLNEYLHPLLRSPLYVPLGSTANKHGRVIADNICGRATPFPGVKGTSICKAFDYTFARTGITELTARQEGHDVETFLCTSPDRPHYYPGMAPLAIKLVVSRRSRVVLGAQVVGPGAADKRIDVAASAIAFKADLDDLANIDLSYAPPYSPPVDPITVAAYCLNNKLDGLANGLPPLQAKQWMDQERDLVLLDVRTPQEFEAMWLEDDRVVHIPLGQLRERAEELPKDKDILAFCKVSMRGYEAQRVLQGLGFERVWFIEGGLVGWPFAVSTPK
jgi:NADPH-dependent 2,4-dienoyl-CoA reductase/sulfur reductase-like enzyme/rhodanese-related sulfurtransferase